MTRIADHDFDSRGNDQTHAKLSYDLYFLLNMKFVFITAMKRFGACAIAMVFLALPPFAMAEGNSETCNTEVSTQNIQKPATQRAFFENVRIALAQGLLLCKAFYTDENMRKFLAVSQSRSGSDQGGDGLPSTVWLRAGDYDGIFPRLEMPGASGPVIDAQISLVWTMTANGVEGGFNFSMLSNGPNFDEMKEVFGGEMVRDKSIPHEPPAPATGLHGNEGWWYTLDTAEGAVHGFIQFNSAGYLEHASFQMQQAKVNANDGVSTVYR